MASLSGALTYFTRSNLRPVAESDVVATTVSVVVPAYNAGAFLAACLDSLLAQSIAPHEIVVVDDASSDATAEIARARAGVELVTLPENRGAGFARAAGARRCTGAIVAFLDSDCTAPRDWIEAIGRAFAADPALGALGGRYAHAERAQGLANVARIEEAYYHHGLAHDPERGNPPAGNSAFRRHVWETARSGCDSYLFRGINSGEDEFLFNEVRRVAKVRYVHDLAVTHLARDARGYLRRHVNRGRSFGLRLATGMLADAKGGVRGYGGAKLIAASGLIGILPVLAIGLAFAPAAAALALAASLAAIAVLSRDFFAFVRTAQPRPGLRATLELAAALPIRTACWAIGATLILAREATRRVARTFNVVVSILHFWVPGRISRLFFFVTSACNARCAFCFNLDNVENWKARKKTELSLDEIRAFTRKLGRLPYLNLSGGEPFMRKDLADLVEAFHVNCRTQWVTIPTNASLADLVLETTLEILTRCPTMFLTIQVSLDGMAQAHDRSRKIEGGFEAMTRTLKALARIRPLYPRLRIQIATLYDSSNAGAIPEIIGYCRDNFAYDQQLFYLIRDTGKLITTTNNHLVHPYLDLLRESEAFEWKKHRQSPWHRAVRALQGLTYGDMAAIRLEGKFLRPCVATRKFFTLYDDGSVSPCEVLETKRFGNIKDFDYDYYRLIRETDGEKYFRDDIVGKKCNCDWMCATPMNMLYDARTLPRLAKALVSPDRIV